jgi:hypothetical protein
MLYGPEHRAWLCAMAQYIEFGYAVWASAQSLVMRYATEFGYAVWVSAQSFVTCYV